MINSGRCLCGKISYDFPNAPTMTGVCHCKNCQRQAGSAFSALAGVPKAELNMIGEPMLYLDSATKSGNQVERYFCGNCGSPIYSLIPSQPDTLFLKTGTMDDTSGFEPQFHAWCSTKQDWVDLAAEVPQMDA